MELRHRVVHRLERLGAVGRRRGEAEVGHPDVAERIDVDAEAGAAQTTSAPAINGMDKARRRLERRRISSLGRNATADGRMSGGTLRGWRRACNDRE
jgi:hypothetical protein